MSWQSRVAKEGTDPERQLWSILNEMVAEKRIEKFVRNDYIVTPFRDYPIQADTLIDDVLAIEVQGEYWHSKPTRQKKDQHKVECFEQMGYGCLWLYDDELNKATIPKYRQTWRPVIKTWIESALLYAHARRIRWLDYMRETKHPTGVHPDLGTVSLESDKRRQ